MTTADGFFSQQTMMTNYVVLQDEEPTKVNPVSSPEEEDRLRRQQQYTYPESEQSRPPSYRSRRASSSYNSDVDSDDEFNTIRQVRAQIGSPLLPVTQPNVGVNCQCENPQCIVCVTNGNAHRAWKRNRKCGRFGKKGKMCLHICISTLLMLIAIICIAGYWFTSRPPFSTSDYQDYDGFCPINRHSENHQFKNFTIITDRPSPSFSLEQVVHSPEQSYPDRYPHLSISGDVQVRNARSDHEIPKDNEILVNVDIWMSDPLISNDLYIYQVKNGVVIESNRTRSTHAPVGRPYGPSCVQIIATVIVPSGSRRTALDYMSIITETLNVGVDSDVQLTIDDETSLKTITGNIHSDGRNWRTNLEEGLKSRKLALSSISGNIKGDWGLSEAGIYETRSGEIDIGLSFLPPLAHSSNETLLDISTISGPINVNPLVPPPNVHWTFPKRFEGFRTYINSMSGNIDGQFFLGSVLSITSISGRIRTDILPVLAEGKTALAEITTDTKSGNQALRFMGGERHGPMFSSMTQSAIAWVEEGSRIFSDFLHRRAHTPSSAKAYSLGLLYANRVDAKFPGLRGIHKSISGALDIHYPQFFEGKIHTSTVSGRIRVGGDVEIIRDIHTPGMKVIQAIKGDEHIGSIEAATISGNLLIEAGHPRFRR